MGERFQFLFSPIKVGPMVLKNRIVFSAHGTFFAQEDNLPGDRQLYYYRERAKGGAGMIVIGGSHAHPNSVWWPGVNAVFDDRSIPMYRRIADAVHEYGAKLLTQVSHLGSQFNSLYTKRALWAPSAVPCVLCRETPKEMELEDIEEVIEYTAHAARNAKESGLDGVELMAAQGYLLGKFFSLYSNKRTDDFGGSLENRMRYAFQLIERVRAEVGPGFVIGMKLNGDDFTPGGLSLQDVQEIAPRLAATKKLDYLHICLGTYHSLHLIVPDQSFPLGGAVYLAAGVKEVVDIPVITVNRINDPMLAEKILADGHADLIAMGRALICDPEFPRKAQEDRLDDIRTCVACTQGCVGRLLKSARMGCIQNPAVGEEKELGVDTFKMAPKRKRVLVAGGGPAGLEAARVAASRGHEVVLYEKRSEFGGQINLIAKCPHRDEFGGIIRYLSNQLDKLKVKVHLGQKVTLEIMEEERPEVVIIATGSIPLKTGFTSLLPDREGIPGAQQDNVFTVSDILEEGVFKEYINLKAN